MIFFQYELRPFTLIEVRKTNAKGRSKEGAKCFSNITGEVMGSNTLEIVKYKQFRRIK